MSDLRELYQEVILDHSRQPRNRGELGGDSCRKADGHNPLCGDKVTVYADVQDGVVRELSFEGVGCAISTASASLMTEALKGKTTGEVQRMFDEFHALMTDDDVTEAEALGKLQVLAGVRDYPVRVKCATLAWHTLKAAIEAGKDAEPVTTE